MTTIANLTEEVEDEAARDDQMNIAAMRKNKGLSINELFAMM